MGDHFEFTLACRLSPEAPATVLAILRAMASPAEGAEVELPDRWLFRSDGWRHFLHVNHEYFDLWLPGEWYCTLRANPNGFSFSFRVFQLDDEFYEHIGFLDWLAPHCTSRGFVGYYRELNDPSPTLLYFDPPAWREERTFEIGNPEDPLW